MTLFLDGERLNGPHVARISARPERIALPIRADGPRSLQETVELECQLWGGAANAILPLDATGQVPEMYKAILPGSQIDRVLGDGYNPVMAMSSEIDLTQERGVFGSQLAAGLLPYRQVDKVAPLEVLELDVDDPWHGIYLACLGRLPERVDPRVIAEGGWLPEIDFTDFLEVRRTRAIGSLEDLVSRTLPINRVLTPRQLSMLDLSYASTASTSIRTNRHVLPRPEFARYDAGPNVLVVCSPGSLDDLALLWNLRAAHGDFYVAPIGVPATELTSTVFQRLVSDPGLARHGFSASTLYVTSCSVSIGELSEALGENGRVSIRPPSDMAMFGAVLGRTQNEVLMWNEGRASFRALELDRSRDILDRRNINKSLVVQSEISVEGSPLPFSGDYRVSTPNGAFYNDAHTTRSSLRSSDRISTIEWPSRLLVASSLASIRDLKLSESSPGIAARILVEMLGGISGASHLCHAPLLALLESMAARQGFNWYKNRRRQDGVEAHPVDSVGSSIDELPEKSFHDFKRVLGNSDAAAKGWLAWAERSSVVIKGFPIQCPQCGAKQWTPVRNFTPPITCRGCAKLIKFPFGDRTSIDFKYRLSEQTRRVYEVDAMGHILVARYFDLIFGFGSKSQLIGMHPGMSVLPAGGGNELGEADLLILTRRGDFIPVEVKRTAEGLTPGELEKLDTLVRAMSSPWSAVAACQYARDAGNPLVTLATQNDDGTYQRLALTYDHLLEPSPMWALDDDPFDLEPLNEEKIKEREAAFVSSLRELTGDTDKDWFTYSMLQRRATPED